MNRRFHFDIRDIPSCTKLGFSIRKIWIALKSLLLSWFVWDCTVYLGSYSAGYSITEIWSRGRLFPVPTYYFWTETLPVILLIFAALSIVFILMKASLKISKITFDEIRGNNFSSESDAAEFASKYSTPLVIVPIILLFVILFGLAIGVLIGVFSRIPVVGGVISTLSIFPLWVLSLLIVLTIFALFASMKLLPAIVATTSGDTYEAVFELYSVLTSQAWRLFAYSITAFTTIGVSVLIFFVFSTLALTVVSYAVSFGAGNSDLISAVVSGPAFIAGGLLPSSFNLPVIGTVSAGLPVLTSIGGWIAALSGMLIFLILPAYVLSAFSASYTLIYVCLRHRKDGENLLEIADSEERTEFEREFKKSSKHPVEN